MGERAGKTWNLSRATPFVTLARDERCGEREGPLKNSEKRSIDPVQLVKRAHMQRRATVSFRTEEDCAD